ncbi:MAG TPA: hypothetical protein PKC28_04435 [Bdellovibrionales bacterium]|nr:hypothetical protein [Bdellovibrionales bacterium]
MNDTNDKLKIALARLEASAQKIIATRGYSRDAKSLKLLEEMVKEQLIHANSRTATRSIR